MPLESLGVERMAVGWTSLLLTESVDWEEFPAYAKEVCSLLGACRGLAIDAPDIRMQGVWIGLRRYWLVFDDFPYGVTLEPRSRFASLAIAAIHAELVSWVRRE